MLEDGADILDVGGESTRPGAEPLDADEELRRVLPVIAGLGGRAGDLRRHLQSVVAREAVARGAAIVNDISALRYDPALGRRRGRSGAAVVLMHNRGRSRDMYQEALYDDVAATIVAELSTAIAARGGGGHQARRDHPRSGPGLREAGRATPMRRWPRSGGWPRSAVPCSAGRRESRF